MDAPRNPNPEHLVMRRTLALGLAVAALAPASALAAPDATGFTLQATQTARKITATQQTFAETLRIGGKVVGHDAISCLVKSPGVGTCKATFTLTNGTITVAGLVHETTATSKLPVTGGSGRYKGARGTLTLTFLSDTKAVESFSLTKFG
jgi:hypothetical protein